jgi:benzoylformate decarboxylase
VDVQLEVAEGLDLSPPKLPDRRVRPPLKPLHRAADILAQAANPAILAGSRVTESGAAKELVLLAERLGARVFAEQQTSHGRLPMPSDHPLYGGPLPLWAPDIHRALSDFDVILVVGMNLLRMYIHHEPDRPIPEHIRLIHLDADPWELGKNFPVEVGLLGDPKAGLGELAQMVSEVIPDGQVDAAAQRRREYAAQRAAAQDALSAEIDAQWAQEPMTALALMGAISRVFPPNGVLVEEAVTTHQNVLERLGVFKDPSGRFAHRGWALGWGLGCALGVKLAWPDRPAVALLGDGAALYGIQGLWTAAHHHVPVCFIIANNAEYRILKVSAEMMGMPALAQGKIPAMDLVDPEVDFVGLAHAFGVEAHRISAPDELTDRVRDALHGSEPVLLDVPIEG